MKLLLDIGNTRVKWAYETNGELTDPGELVHRDRLPACLHELRDALAQRPTSVVAVNVAGAATGKRFATLIEETWAVPTRFMTVSERCGEVMNGYSEWQQLGVDRWAAVVGAWHALHTDVCVVDAGTAVTIDLLRADGRHMGGVILPGLAMMEHSLGVATSDIAGFAAGRSGPGDNDWYGRATAEAVQRGAHFSICAAIDRATEAFPTGAVPTVVLTGGDAGVLQSGLRNASLLRPLLVLEGLRHLAGGPD